MRNKGQQRLEDALPEFGSWRQPDMLVAVFALDDDGVPLAFGSPSLVELGAIDDPAGQEAVISATQVNFYQFGRVFHDGGFNTLIA